MTGKIINLRLARKAKTRSEKEKRAEENRLTFGRSKAEKKRDAAEKSITENRLEGHRRKNPADQDDP
ncbi:DUF4169 family protein [Rhizobiales bacterium]|uniref:DUF4169 family protein n=1 Tax=Hongsoonwoonella zoysiae TaxID=2821844 RepID=UPI001560DEAA|nr:DUF4169 family protein [Hongsoonwoonella zoysiae]NRG17863.1 DUF4169 family protein [Hongsoonwoonella zoysiae]